MKLRSFIAINLPPEIKKYLGELIDELKQKNEAPQTCVFNSSHKYSGGAKSAETEEWSKDSLSPKYIRSSVKADNSSDIKWVNPEGIHLTLHFLGSLDEEKIEQVKKIVQESVIGLNPIEIELKDFGGFPNLQQPRVLFISGRESSFSAKDASFVPQGGTTKAKSEDNRSTIKTLQRKLGLELEKIGLEVDKKPWQIHFTLARLKVPTKLLVTNYQLLSQSFQVKSIDLMKSELTPQGARYSILTSFPLI